MMIESGAGSTACGPAPDLVASEDRVILAIEESRSLSAEQCESTEGEHP